jgi:hypothetical protein
MKTDNERFNDLANRLMDKRFGTLRHLLLVASTALGILVSLHSNSSQPYIHRLLFGSATALLSLGCISIVVALYGEIDTLTRLLRSLHAELKRAKSVGERAKPVGVGAKKLFLAAETCAYVFVAISFLLLSLYAFVK